MNQQSNDEMRNVPLNPALKSETETIYPTTESSPAPIDTTSATKTDGQGWPIVWLVVTVLGIALAIYFMV